jgi:hypothetical protein
MKSGLGIRNQEGKRTNKKCEEISYSEVLDVLVYGSLKALHESFIIAEELLVTKKLDPDPKHKVLSNVSAICLQENLKY